MPSIYFIENDTSELLKEAYEALSELDEQTIFQISEEDVIHRFSCLKLDCVFILSSFEGKVYEHLNNLGFLLTGPQIILHCICNDEPLPLRSVYSGAMSDVTVCFSSLDKDDRKRLTTLVEYMNGKVNNDMTESVNVLVTNKPGSVKYYVAAKKKLPILKPNWIFDMWSMSFNTFPISAFEDHILNRYKLGVFSSFCICLSGLTVAEKEIAVSLIENNGGEYVADLIAGRCTHLVAKDSSTTKVAFAKKWQIVVVNTAWLADSVDEGILKNELKYPVKPPIATMNKLNNDNNEEPVDDSNVTRINDSFSVFDNCNIAFVGFNDGNIVERLIQEIEIHGGNVVDPTDDNVTHRIVFNSNYVENDIRVKNVSLDWIEGSIKSRKLLPEQDFIVHQVEKQSLHIIPESLSKDFELLSNYYSSTEPYRGFGVFSGKVFLFLDDNSTELAKLIEAGYGQVVSEATNDCYVICNAILMDNVKFIVPVTLVTGYFVESCRSNGKFLSPDDDFLFKPIIGCSIPNDLFDKCVFSFSGYPNTERDLLKTICSRFGAVCQEKFSRKAIPNKHIRKTTHLIISRVDKVKYPFAIEWKIPAVTIQWLKECLLQKQLLEPCNYALTLFDGVSNGNQLVLTSVSSDITVNQLADERKMIFENAVIYFLKMNTHLVQKLKEIVEQYGGVVSDIYDYKVVTHVIYDEESIVDDESKTIRTISDNKTLIVRAKWLLDCQQENRWLIEQNYVYTPSSANLRKRKADEDLNGVPQSKIRIMSDRVGSLHSKCNKEIEWDYCDTPQSPNSIRTIMFNGIDKVNRTQYTTQILKLGGKVESGEDYASVTHLISILPGRNEKCLAVISNGKWILHESYLIDSFDAGEWLSESKYEWGGPNTDLYFQLSKKIITKTERNLAAASKRMRETGGKVFSHWRVCLFDTDFNISRITKIIECGNGTVVPANPLPDPASVTHVLINKEHMPDVSNLSAFRCFRMEFIAYYLAASTDEEKTKLARKCAMVPKLSK